MNLRQIWLPGNQLWYKSGENMIFRVRRFPIKVKISDKLAPPQFPQLDVYPSQLAVAILQSQAMTKLVFFLTWFDKCHIRQQNSKNSVCPNKSFL